MKEGKTGRPQLPRRKSDPRSGYAVLMIFCMAATVAIMLYMQLPRAAFEAQRDREQLLIDHGKEYARGVALYVRKLKRFPPTMEALENTNGIRFLRRKYKDPMTGKDEWRLIHVGPNGVFTDSKVYGKKDKKTGDPQTFITEMQQVGGTVPTGDTAVNLAMRRRQSDGPGAPGTGDPNAPGTPNANGTGTGPSTPPPPNAAGMQVLPDGRLVPIQIQNGMIVGAGSQPLPGQQPGLPASAQLPPGVGVQQGQNAAIPGQPGAVPPNNAPGTQPGAPAGPAADMIRNLLTSPRPGGAFGTPVANSGSASAPAGQTIGGGIAGVASNLEQEGIKTYNERTSYAEWEFVYDMSKDLGMAGAAGQQGLPQAGQAGPNGQPGQPGQTAQPGQTGQPGMPASPAFPPKQ